MKSTLPTILVTGATGKTGAAVATQLLERGWPVRAMVRVRDERSERLERLGARTVIADLFDPDQLVEAMRGTARAYYCPPWSPFMIQSATAFAVAAREAGLEAIVGLSQWLASPGHPSLLTRQHWLADRVFAMLPGVSYVVINPGYFADNYLNENLIGLAAHLGIFPWPYGTGKNAPPSNEDIARVAVAALMDPHRHDGRAYRPTGPELLDGRQMAAIVGRVVGRSVRAIDLPEFVFLKALRQSGYTAFQQNDIRRYAEEHRRGTWEVNAPTGDVLELTGRAPETFETIASRYAAHPIASRTPGNFWRTVAEFAAMGITPVEDLARYERTHDLPLAPRPRFAIEDERWLIAHDADAVDRTGIVRLAPRDDAASAPEVLLARVREVVA